MKLNLAFLAVLLAGVAILLSLAATSAHTGSAWRALGESEFRPLVPAVPGSAGFGTGIGGSFQPPSGRSVDLVPAETKPSSTPPSGPTPTHLATPTTRPCCASSTVSVKGTATWYAYHEGQAAAALRLRDALGPNWRGMRVRVCAEHEKFSCIDVVLTDFESSTIPGRVIDLDERDWAAICGDTARGVCSVVVTR